MKFRIENKRTKKTVNFEALLPGVLDDIGIKDSFLVEGIKNTWKDIVGTILFEHSVPDRMFKNSLYILVDHSIYANELMLMKDAILKNIIELTAINIIQDMRVEIKKINWKNKSGK